MATAKKAVSKKAAGKKVATQRTVENAVARKPPIKRTLVESDPGEKRYVRRDLEGTFNDAVDVGKSSSGDTRSVAKTKVKPGQGDKGDVGR